MVGAQPPRGTPDERPTLQFIHQRVSKENVDYRSNLRKKEERPSSLPITINAKKGKLKKVVLEEERFKTNISSFLICINLWLKFTVKTQASYQVIHLTLPMQARDPPYIL